MWSINSRRLQSIMINSFFKTTINRPSQQSAPSSNRLSFDKPYLQVKFKKYKLIILLLTKATAKTLKLSFDAINEWAKIVPSALNKLSNLCEKNTNLSVYLAFDRVKIAASQQKSNEKIIKNIVNLLQRIEKYKLKQAFGKIVLSSARNDRSFIKNYLTQRGPQFLRKMNLLLKRKKQMTFGKIKEWSRFIKSYNKLRVIAVIRGRLQRQAKQLFFSRLNRYLLKRTSKGAAQKQVGELKTQLQDLAIQLQNKNQNIQRLETEIEQFKVEQSNQSFNQTLSYGQYNNRSRGNIQKTYSQKKMSFNDKSARGSAVGSNQELSLNDVSLGSILGNLNRSRNGSISRMDSAGQCNCGFRAKYQKYKNLHESFKNQLQIVKEQLEVAKDLNEHFTNQIKNYLGGDGNDGDYQKLKRENQVLLDERDQLREKVFKYQKHINNLKAEFKVKMEELYRKVRKDM